MPMFPLIQRLVWGLATLYKSLPLRVARDMVAVKCGGRSTPIVRGSHTRSGNRNKQGQADALVIRARQRQAFWRF